MGNVKNISASVRERLKNIAKQSGKTFDLILLLYFQERFWQQKNNSIQSICRC